MTEPSEAIAHMATLRIQTMLKEPTFTDHRGEIGLYADAADWHDIEVHPCPHKCDHIETMCEFCAETWAQDHYIRILNTDGRVLSLNGAPGIPDIRDLPA